MYYVLVLLSKKDQSLYKFTVNLKERLRQHNTGESVATKGGALYVLLYYEAYRAPKRC